MVQTQNKFLDDLAKLATGAAGTLHGLKGEIEGMVRQRVERWAADLDLVSREEFEAVRAMALEARKENEELRARLDSLEGEANARADAGSTTWGETGGTEPGPFSPPPGAA